MNKLPPAKRAQILRMLVEGSSIRGTARMAEVSVNTVMKLLIDAGTICAAYQDIHLRNLKSERIQVDEIWSFCHAKRQNLKKEHRNLQGYGDVWTFTAIDPDTKLVPCWRVGNRDAYNTTKFIRDLHSRMANRIQLTSDGNVAYLDGVDRYFGYKVNYAMVVKYYGESVIPNKETVKDRFMECRKSVIQGYPEEKHITTSHVERFNLTMRTNIKRFARKTNAHSKKMANHNHAIALHVFHYNFVRIHSTIKVTPAMAAGVTDRLWDMADLVKMVDTLIAIPEKDRNDTNVRRKAVMAYSL